jgi:hypothetical protein
MNLKQILHIVNKFGNGFKYNILHKTKDKFTYKGNVLAIIEEGDRRWIAHEKYNMIVNLARPAMSALLAEADTDYIVDTFKIGTQGHDLVTPDILTPVSPSVTDTDLIDGSPFEKAIDHYNYLPILSPTSVQFVAILEKAEGNGTGTVTYTEAGLWMAGGNMFARETFPAIVKNSSRKVTFYWSILF